MAPNPDSLRAIISGLPFIYEKLWHVLSALEYGLVQGGLKLSAFHMEKASTDRQQRLLGVLFLPCLVPLDIAEAEQV